MTLPPRAFITGFGIITAAGKNKKETLDSLQQGRSALARLTLFDTTLEPPPMVGQVDGVATNGQIRSNALALIAAEEALADDPGPIDALVMGVTTGGVLTLEEILRPREKEVAKYRDIVGPVTWSLSRKLECRGPAWSISTACSSSAVALKIGLELIRTGEYHRVLVCGTESLSRLTIYGFHFLQLLDPLGTRPFDKHRAGMSLGEGAAALLLTAAHEAPPLAVAELRGGGLTCDAYHPIAPHPEGIGAAAAINSALRDAGVTPFQIDYINLHGTGTLDNDISESAAIRSVFATPYPPLSSTKGIFGHTTSAAGAVEAVVALLAIQNEFVPPNVNLAQTDPRLELEPVSRSETRRIACVLSNSFGFGGNNAAIVLGRPDLPPPDARQAVFSELNVLGTACLTGRGAVEATLTDLASGKPVTGKLALAEIGADLPTKMLRRLKRLPRLALSVAHKALENARQSHPEVDPDSVFLGTGWGTQSETHSFLRQLFESHETLSSPVDFIGSVHNAPAGQIALNLQCTGANITSWGGHQSFDEALFLTGLLGANTGGDIVLLGVDEAHEDVMPHSEPEAYARTGLSDGGGCLVLRPVAPDGLASGTRIKPVYITSGMNHDEAITGLISRLKDSRNINETFGAVLAGLPSSEWDGANQQLDAFIILSGFNGPVIDYRAWVGDFPAASAIAAVLAVEWVLSGRLPKPPVGNGDYLNGRGILLLSLGNTLACAAVMPG
jgi:3-oxoacyl-(acyl-carrier-protein) synthase